MERNDWHCMERNGWHSLERYSQFVGKRYFNELRDSDEKIASNILTDRLNKLEASGIIIKTKDSKHKQKNIYTLTEQGIDLMPTSYKWHLGVWFIEN